MENAVNEGLAIRKMQAIVNAQGGDPRVVEEPDRLPLSKHRAKLVAEASGFITDIDPLELGYVSMALGAGRVRADDTVDAGAGIRLHVRIGDQIQKGKTLATLYASEQSRLRLGTQRARDAFRIAKRRRRQRGRLIDVIRR
jgi:thymidine phosphorylase